MKKNYLFPMVLGCLVITSCSSGGDGNEEPVVPPVTAPKYVDFNPTVNALSRATETQFDQGDAIGVFAVASSGNDSKGIIADNGNYADNVKYSYSGTKFSATATGIEKPSGGTKVYYHAVYPYMPEAKNKFTFTVKGNQDSYDTYTTSDLLTASTTATDDQLIALKFDHRLCKMTFNLEGDNWPSGNMTMTMNNVYASVSVDLNTLSFTATGSKGNIVCAGNGTKSFKVILPPQGFTKGSVIATINVGGKDYPLTTNDDSEINSGKQGDFTISMTENKEIVEFTGDINPWGTEDKIDEVVPSEIQKKINIYIPIHKGSNPPIVEGGYIGTKFVTVHCEDYGSGGYADGDVVSDLYFLFKNQNTSKNTLDYEEKQGSGSLVGEGAFISGSGNDFTAFFNTTGTYSGVSVKTALVISGTKTSSGIKDMRYAFIMVEKGADPENKLMKEGVYRIFKDDDGLASNYAWTKSAANPRNTQPAFFDMAAHLK